MKPVICLKLFLVCLAALPVLLLSTGCSTTKGFGEDLETLGRGISDASDEATGN